MDLTALAVDARSAEDLAELLRSLRRREARRRNDTPFTYRELAARTGWSHGSVGAYLTGRVLPPTDRFDVLVQLLGAAPAELRALADARDRIEEEEAARPASPGAGAVVPRQLPADVAGFAGRAEAIDALDAARGLVVVTGTAGVGKTALAVRWAHRAASRFPGGQLYLDLRGFGPAGQIDRADAVDVLLAALGVTGDRLPAGLDARIGLYRSLLHGTRTLVVLDNAADAEQVRPLLPGAGDAMVVVTSRNQLAGLVATDAAIPVVLDQLSAAEARQLLAVRLGEQRVAAEPVAAGTIITACARLPLALVVAAARGALRPAAPLAELARDLASARADEALATWHGGDPASDVRTVFSWSYRMLSPAAATLFRLLSLAPGPEFGEPVAAALAGADPATARRALAELVHASLVAEPSPGRFGMHDLLRAYSTELSGTIDPAADRDAAVRRVLDHLVLSASAAAAQLDPHRARHTPAATWPGVTVNVPADATEALAWFTTEHRTLLTGVRRAGATGNDPHAWQLAWAMVDYLDRRGHWSDWVAVHTVALAAAESAADRVGLAVTRHQLGRACVRLGRYAEAERHLAAALDDYRACGDESGEAWVHGTLGFIADRRDRHRDAVEHLGRSLRLLRRTGDRTGEGAALANLGWAYANLAEYPAALEFCRQALELQRETGDRTGEAYSWDSLGFIHHRLGDRAEAVAGYQRALAMWQAAGDRYNESETLTHLGDLHADAGDPDRAGASWQAALVILEDLGHPDTAALRHRLEQALVGRPEPRR